MKTATVLISAKLPFQPPNEAHALSVSAGEGGYIRYAPMSREILGSVPYFYGGTKLKQPDFTENIWQSIHAAPAQDNTEERRSAVGGASQDSGLAQGDKGSGFRVQVLHTKKFRLPDLGGVLRSFSGKRNGTSSGLLRDK